MYKKLQIIILGFLGCLAFQTYSIKLTNSTNDTLLYCCGNPADKNTFVQKYELSPGATVEITEQQNYLQIYSKQKPNTLRGKYPLSNQSEDLTIIIQPPLGILKFVTRSNLTEQPKKINPKISVPGFGMTKPTTKMDVFKAHLAEKQAVLKASENLETKRDLTQTELLKDRAQNTQNNGRRKPSRNHLKQKAKMNDVYGQMDEICESENDKAQANILIEPENLTQTSSNENITEPATQPLIDSNGSSENTINASNVNESSAASKEPEKKEIPTSITQIQELKDITIAKSKPVLLKKQVQKKSSYFTKKKVATVLGLGVAGTACLLVWWYSKFTLPVPGF